MFSGRLPAVGFLIYSSALVLLLDPFIDDTFPGCSLRGNCSIEFFFFFLKIGTSWIMFYL